MAAFIIGFVCIGGTGIIMALITPTASNFAIVTIAQICAFVSFVAGMLLIAHLFK